MSRMGRPPKPEAVKRLAGTARKDRARPDAVKAPPGIPVCPDYLDDIGRAEWARVVPILGEMGVLSSVDGAALEGYCASYARAVQAEKAIREGGLVLSLPHCVQANPAVSIARNEWAAVRRFAGEFGLSPSAREGIKGPQKAQKDDAADFLFAGAPTLSIVKGGAHG